MAEIVANRLVEHLARAGLVAMNRPPIRGAALGHRAAVPSPGIDPWTCMGRLVSRLVLDHLISWFDREATISSSRPNFGWPLRGEAVNGGRRPSRSDLPLMATSAAADLLDRESQFWEPDLRRYRGELAIRRNFAPQTCIRLIREDRNHDAVVRIGGEAPRRRAHSKPRLEDHVQYRVAVTSARHLRLGLDRRANRRTSVLLACRQFITPSAEGADLPAPRRWSPAAKVQ